MKIKKILAIILVLCFAALALCGCVQLRLDYTDEIDVSFSEPYGYKLFSHSGGYSTQYEGITYYFDKDIDENQRNEFVTETVAVLKDIQIRIGIEASEKIIYICSDDYEPRADEQLYLGYPCFKTTEYIVGLCKMLFGNEVNYGVLYGLANNIAVSRGYGDEQQELEQALTLCEDAPEYLDLNYPCFLANYADEVTLSKVKTIASEFYSFLEDNDKIDLITDFTSQKYTAYLNDFLSINDKPYYDNSDLDGIIVYGGGQAVRLIWETSQSAFYLMDNFEVKSINLYHGELDMLNSDYPALRKIFIIYKAQGEYVQNLFADYGIKPQATVRFSKESEYYAKYGGVFIQQTSEIFCFAVGTYIHEYIHYLTYCESPAPSWICEAIAYYYKSSTVSEPLSQNRYDEKAYYLNLDPANSEEKEFYDLFKTVEISLGREIDFLSDDDYFYFKNFAVVYWNSYSRLKFDKGEGSPKISFYHYLLSLADEKQVMNAVYYNTPEEIFGKDWDELAIDWEQFLRQEFAWMS